MAGRRSRCPSARRAELARRQAGAGPPEPGGRWSRFAPLVAAVDRANAGKTAQTNPGGPPAAMRTPPMHDRLMEPAGMKGLEQVVEVSVQQRHVDQAEL